MHLAMEGLGVAAARHVPFEVVDVAIEIPFEHQPPLSTGCTRSLLRAIGICSADTNRLIWRQNFMHEMSSSGSTDLAVHPFSYKPIDPTSKRQLMKGGPLLQCTTSGAIGRRELSPLR